MITINARNVNDAYVRGMRLVNSRGIRRESRVGPVKRMSQSVTTTYARPTERVLFNVRRDANPFFHLFEALWMLNGGNDLETITRFLPSFAQFSDDGKTLNGAYGFRWRSHFGLLTEIETGIGMQSEWTSIDQLKIAIDMLKKNPDDRRVVIQMWDVMTDLDANSKDIPCNDMIKLSVTNGVLDMIVFCRSNDIVFGAYGANAVHMSMLQEYLASMIGVGVGVYEQISCDFHAYLKVPYEFSSYFPLEDSTLGDGYNGFTVWPLVSVPGTFDNELRWFMEKVRSWSAISVEHISEFSNSFFFRVAWPMYMAYRMHRHGHTREAIELLNDPHDVDWLRASQLWLSRRAK